MNFSVRYLLKKNLVFKPMYMLSDKSKSLDTFIYSKLYKKVPLWYKREDIKYGSSDAIIGVIDKTSLSYLNLSEYSNLDWDFITERCVITAETFSKFKKYINLEKLAENKRLWKCEIYGYDDASINFILDRIDINKIVDKMYLTDKLVSKHFSRFNLDLLCRNYSLNSELIEKYKDILPFNIIMRYFPESVSDDFIINNYKLVGVHNVVKYKKLTNDFMYKVLKQRKTCNMRGKKFKDLFINALSNYYGEMYKDLFIH